MRCIDLILDAHNGEKISSEIPVYIKNYFIECGDKLQLKNEHEVLINFLHKTRKYQVNSIAPYLYLAQDEITIRAGDELQRRILFALRSRNLQTVKELLNESESLVDVIQYQLTINDDEIEDILWISAMIYNDIDESKKQGLAQTIIERTIELVDSGCEFLYRVPGEIVFSIAEIGENTTFNQQFVLKYLFAISNDSWYSENEFCDALSEIFENYSILNTESRSKLKEICNYCLNKEDIDITKLYKIIIPERPEFMEYWGIQWFEKICNYMEIVNDFSQVTIENMIAAFNAIRRFDSIEKLVDVLLPLTKYSAFLPIIESAIGQKIDENSDSIVKDTITPDQGTKLLENVIKHDFKNNGETMCKIIDGLAYNISENNASEMDKFTLNYVSTYDLDNILIYCGSCSFFKLLPKTIESLMNEIFKGKENDDLLSKTAKYFTSDQIMFLGKKLLNACAYSGKAYERELSIINILSGVEEFKEEIEKIANDKIIPQFQSYHSYENYRNFTSEAMGYMRDALSQQCIDKYINVLASKYNSYRQFCLEAVSKVTMKMSPDTYKVIFDKIVTQSQNADFEKAFEVIENHNDIRPKDAGSQEKHISFMVTHLPYANNPDNVLISICNNYRKITMLQEMAINAQANSKCTNETLSNSIAHFVNDMDDIEAVTKTFIKFAKTGIAAETLYKSLSKINNYRVDEVYEKLIDDIKDVNLEKALICIVDIALYEVNKLTARSLILECLLETFKGINLVGCSKVILGKLKDNEMYFKQNKSMLADVLRSGFKSTTSDELKRDILLIVSSLKLKVQFKKSLDSADLEFYKKWIGS